ncbi:hypothetical protein HII31_09388 [Pseudocercospora fuligena]|uniref:Uncharacterized protein n=1 Tax=Pseudocercospora fuligena TaxID=685502 RepID=A0A8H6VF88_9PEZI|nr:hypothetical protein HII31_09388 [Pseudocercospora fuligena]
MGNSNSRGYSIRDAEREQHLKGNVHVIGRVPAHLVAQHQKNALETQQQRRLLEHQNQAMHHQMHGDIFHRLGKIEAGVKNLTRLAYGGTMGSSSGGSSSEKKAKARHGVQGNPVELTADNVKAAAVQAAAGDEAIAAPANDVQVPEGVYPPKARHRRALAPPTHGSRALGMHRGPPWRATRARARAARTRMGWYVG